MILSRMGRCFARSKAASLNSLLLMRIGLGSTGGEAKSSVDESGSEDWEDPLLLLRFE